MNQTQEPAYRDDTGPAGLLTPAAANMGIHLPEDGEGLIEGRIDPLEKAMEAAAIAMLTRMNPTLFPGPLMLWGWNDLTIEKSAPFFDVANEIPGVRIIPMPD